MGRDILKPLGNGLNGHNEEIDFTCKVVCKFCGQQCAADTAHLHDGSWVGDECCWDERLKITE